MRSKNSIYFIIFTSVSIMLSACTTESMQSSKQAQQGFSNIRDVPLPQTAKVDMTKSMVVGGGDSWTGQLVYNTAQTPAEVVDFINSKMQAADWTKISELRGTETVFSFMKQKRVATILIKNDTGYLANNTVVSIGMTNSHSRIVDAVAVNTESLIEKS